MGTDVIVREAVEVVTDAERRARVLEAAALEIEVRGWLQGKLCDDAGRICLLGGIDAVIDASDLRDSMTVWNPNWLTELPPDEGGKLRPAAFNDVDGRTADEVTFLLRWRAEEIRDGR